MKRRITSLSMAILLAVLFILGGCKQAEPTPTPALPTVDAAIEQEDLPDLGGREIKVGYAIYFGSAGASNAVTSRATRHLEQVKIEQIEKKYNCKITLVENAGMEDISVTSSIWYSWKYPDMDPNPIVDIYITHENALGNLNLIDLGEYSDELESNNHDLWNVEKNTRYKRGNHTYFLFTNNVYENYMHNDLMFFNKTLLEDMGLWEEYNLYEMQKNKTWTWDVFSELCTKVTEYDKNKKGIYFGYKVLNDFAVSNHKDTGENASVVQHNEEGKPIITMKGESQKAALDLFRTLGEKNCLRMSNDVNKLTDDTITKNSDISDVFDNNAVKFNGSVSNAESFENFKKGNDLFMTTTGDQMYTLDHKFDGVDFEWGVVAMPLGPNNKEYVITNSYSPAYTIPKGVDKPEELVPILKELATPAVSAKEMITLATEQMKQEFDADVAATYSLLSSPEALYPDTFTNYSGNFALFSLYCAKYCKGDYSEKELLDIIMPKAEKIMQDTVSEVVVDEDNRTSVISKN